MANPAAQTALGPMIVVAADQHEPEPLMHDPWAAQLLPTAGRFTAALTRWSPVRTALKSATNKKISGGWSSFLCRKRYIDDQLRAALVNDIDAVVILGAGYDTRAVRLPELADIGVCEVDLPANTMRKTAALHRAFGRTPPNMTLVPVDFETDDLTEVLGRAGFGPHRRTFYVWEAVTQYLTESAVRRTLAYLAQAAPGSVLAFTYVREDFLTGQHTYGAEGAREQFVVKSPLWRFGLRPTAVGSFLAEYGWREVEQVGPAEYAARYLVPAGRDLAVSEIERAVSAERAPR
ncbi:SAM-dependent methyltransferase [Mycobacterium sp. CVI_P3]|uniref:S-adenosyl-L-methionine-dependent methyltransferase n=1 Tax=Mycobacterium pinniadriaticum TaxID=2994102 RepID=A0ABT3S7N1_9MYCO|nr:SAM-dependent methyltransferase [Mycobacterium pinniadriaticum]MCX2929088.1 SAM-dependent methyltransferase [Mycobacterium pinniadriaticum]MCX2935513.1 SAM-dependent methyltransferase [Mycobacterium pinniadriaticum]